jgi:predicted RNA-binding protein Jag
MNPDAPERKASVLIFGAAEGYYQYSERTSGDRSENTLGHFSPSTGQLLLFLEEDPSDWNSYHVIFHEGMHQWCHSNGLSLPFWANEGMAEYVGGTRLSEDGSTIEERGAIDSFLKQRLRNLTANWKQRLTWQKIMTESPQEFYAGNAPLKYAQAWTMIHFMMESGFVDGEGQELKKTFEAYLQHFKEVSLDEKRQAQGGAKLEYIYVDTFHQLDMEKVTEAWEKWVEKLASKMGMRWTVPDDEDE